LLELKVASFTALEYSDVWKMFGDGRHPNFRELLITKLSPHLSSYAFQYWLQHGEAAFGNRKGLYNTGGSRHALQLSQWLFKVVGLQKHVERFCQSETMNEQREIWHKSLRKVLLSRLLAWTVIGNKAWLWKALGVPAAQREMIEQDYLRQTREGDTVEPPTSSPHENGAISAAALTNGSGSPASSPSSLGEVATFGSGKAIWEYAVNTLDPVATSTSVSEDNHYYLLCLLGHYTRRCHPTYLTPRSHMKLSKPDAFNGRLSIHTDELQEVLERMAPATLTIAVVMDSMDWFDPGSDAAAVQILKLNRAVKKGGRVMLRSAGLNPWYVAVFEKHGFSGKRVAGRLPGSCIDRVNM
jgi:betaine lipid synthase